MLSAERLTAILEQFPRLTIALVGDLFLDRYLEIDAAADEPSIETGLTAHQVTRVRNSPGALGTVMNNLAALGVGRLLPVTVIGDDGHGYDLRRELEKLPVDQQFIVCDPERLTPTYTKPLRPDEAGQRRELNRLDVRTRGPLSSSAEAELLRRLDAAFEASDGAIVLDQINEADWGVVNGRVRGHLEKLVGRRPEKLAFVDSRRRLGEFRFGVLKGNRAEVLAAAGVDDVSEAAGRMSAVTRRPVFATLGERGILVRRPSGDCHTVPAVPVAGPVDIVGAGDSATAALAPSLLTGADEIEAAEIACLVASITIQQVGTTGVATPEQVVERRNLLAG
ncbi:MAG: carbohydrate kinase [Planctomycetes bacterium]|nr:carbohydrate kinase [Planctomycetota bacterium]